MKGAIVYLLDHLFLSAFIPLRVLQIHVMYREVPARIKQKRSNVEDHPQQ